MTKQDIDWTFEITYHGADCTMNVLTIGETTYITAKTWSVFEDEEDVEAFRVITDDEKFIATAIDALGEIADARFEKPERSWWGAP